MNRMLWPTELRRHNGLAEQARFIIHTSMSFVKHFSSFFSTFLKKVFTGNIFLAKPHKAPETSRNSHSYSHRSSANPNAPECPESKVLPIAHPHLPSKTQISQQACQQLGNQQFEGTATLICDSIKDILNPADESSTGYRFQM